MQAALYEGRQLGQVVLTSLTGIRCVIASVV